MKQKQELLSTQESAAHAARLGAVESVPHFPSPLSKDVASALAKIHSCDLYDVESQSSAVTAAVASSLAGKRVFLPLSDIAVISEFQAAAALRAPVVAVCQGAFALRDCGWLIFYPATNQELLDTIIQAYMVSEDRRVLLPSMVAVDMHLRETVAVPTGQSVAKMMPKLKLPRKISLKESYRFDSEEKNYGQMQVAMGNALKLLQKTDEKWGKKFKRNYGLTEKFLLDDAEYVLIMDGYQSGTAKSAIRKLRQNGEKVGLLRLRVLRPWPGEEIVKALAGAKKMAVIDGAISLGASGILHTQVKATVSGHISSFIAQKRMSEKDFSDIFSRLKKEEKPERVWM